MYGILFSSVAGPYYKRAGNPVEGPHSLTLGSSDSSMTDAAGPVEAANPGCGSR